MDRSVLRGVFFGVCAASAVFGAACGDEDLEPPRQLRDGGATDDATTGPGPSGGGDATTETDGGVIPGVDGAPPPPPPPVDAGPDARNVWALEDYCEADAGCALPPCPGGDAGVGVGLEARDCTTPFARCASAGDVDAGVLGRAYRCIPGRRAVWAVEDLCGPITGLDCATVDAGACPTPDAGDGGSLGVNCAPPQGRCVDLGADTVYACDPQGLRWMFSGYCGDAGFGACSGAACVIGDGGVSGSVCLAPFTRCNTGGRQYVCARR